MIDKIPQLPCLRLLASPSHIFFSNCRPKQGIQLWIVKRKNQQHSSHLTLLSCSSTLSPTKQSPPPVILYRYRYSILERERRGRNLFGDYRQTRASSWTPSRPVGSEPKPGCRTRASSSWNAEWSLRCRTRVGRGRARFGQCDCRGRGRHGRRSRNRGRSSALPFHSDSALPSLLFGGNWKYGVVCLRVAVVGLGTEKKRMVTLLFFYRS